MTAQQLADKLEATGKYESIRVVKGEPNHFKDWHIGFMKKGGTRFMWLYEADGMLWFDHVYSTNTGKVSRGLMANYPALKRIGYFDIENR